MSKYRTIFSSYSTRRVSRKLGIVDILILKQERAMAKKRRESSLKAVLFKEVLMRQGCLHYSNIARKENPIGWPDDYIAHLKWTGLIEFKRESGALTPAQRACIADLVLRRAHVAICRLYEDRTFELEDLTGAALCARRPWIKLLDTLKEFIRYSF